MSLLITVSLWGINLPIMKYSIERMDKYSFNAIRLLISAVVLGVIVWWLKAPVIDRRENAKPVRTQWMHILLFAILTGFGYQILFLIGIDSTSAGNTSLILSAIPMWAAILSFFFLKERMPLASWGGLFVAILGVLIVTLCKTPESNSTNSLGGNLLVSAAAFSWAAASVLSMPMMRHISPVALTFYSIAMAIPLHFFIAGSELEYTALLNDPWLLLAILYSGIFSTGVASALWNYGLKYVGPSHATAFQYLVPIIALLAAWIMLGEVPFALQIGGGLLIIMGLIVMRTWKKTPEQVPQKQRTRSK